MKKYDEKYFVNLFMIIIIALVYFLSFYSFLSMLFWPNDALSVLDYIIEILAYGLIATVLLLKRKPLVDKLMK